MFGVTQHSEVLIITIVELFADVGGTLTLRKPGTDRHLDAADQVRSHRLGRG